jgi:hypothetical protein
MDTQQLRRAAASLSYNNDRPEPQIKHLLLESAMRIDHLKGLLATIRSEAKLNGYWHLDISDEVDALLDKA